MTVLLEPASQTRDVLSYEVVTIRLPVGAEPRGADQGGAPFEGSDEPTGVGVPDPRRAVL